MVADPVKRERAAPEIGSESRSGRGEATVVREEVDRTPARRPRTAAMGMTISLAHGFALGHCEVTTSHLLLCVDPHGSRRPPLPGERCGKGRISRFPPLWFRIGRGDRQRNGRLLGRGDVSAFVPLMLAKETPCKQATFDREVNHVLYSIKSVSQKHATDFDLLEPDHTSWLDQSSTRHCIQSIY
jgi:hypothetical protein